MKQTATFAVAKGMRALVKALVLEDLDGTTHALALTLNGTGFLTLCSMSVHTFIDGSPVRPNTPLRKGAVTCLSCLSIG